MATYLQLQDRVLDATKRAVGTDRGEVKLLLNDSMAEIAGRLGLYTKVTNPVTLTAGVMDYDITQTPFLITDLSNLLSIVATQTAYLDTPDLNRLTVDQILEMRQVPTILPIRIRSYAFRPYTNLMFDAPPATGDAVTVYYSAYPPDLVADSDVPAYIPRDWWTRK